MNKWAFALAAGILVLAGCAGGGGSSSGGGPGGGNGDSTAFVTGLDKPAQLQNVYLTGQGRIAGDMTAEIRRLVFDDAFGVIEPPLVQPIRLLLNGYTSQSISANINTVSTRLFDHYNLEVEKLLVDNGDGSNTEYTGQNQALVSEVFNAQIRVFPGRQTSVSVRLDDSMFIVGVGPNGATFDRNQFEVVNYDPDDNMMHGYLSDYVMFDISNMPASLQPDLPDGSGKATVVFASGDNFAMGVRSLGPQDQASADPQKFFVLTRTGFVEGLHVGERTANDGQGHSTVLPGTYSLIQPDPRPPFDPDARITAMVGTYRLFTKTIAGTGANAQQFEIIAFPNSNDDGSDDCIAFNYVGGQLTNVYFGFMDFNVGDVHLFPIDQLDTPEDTSNEISGTISSLVDGSGVPTSDVSAVRAGRYDLTNGLVGNVSASGRFIVYRR